MDPDKFHVVVLVWVIIHEASVIKNAIEYIVGVVEARANFKRTRDCIEKYEEQPEQPNVFKFSSAYITRQCRRAKELCALQLACDVKLELHAPTLLYNICWSDSVGTLSSHVFRLFFCWMNVWGLIKHLSYKRYRTNMGAKRSSIVGSTNVVSE